MRKRSKLSFARLGIYDRGPEKWRKCALAVPEIYGVASRSWAVHVLTNGGLSSELMERDFDAGSS